MATFLERMRTLANTLGNRAPDTSFTDAQLREQYGVNFCRHFHRGGVAEFGGRPVEELNDEELAYLAVVEIKRFLRDCITASALRQIEDGIASTKAQTALAIEAAVSAETFE